MLLCGGFSGRAAAADPLRLRGDNLVQLDLVYLQRATFRPSDCIEIHVGRREKNDRHIKTLRRVRRVDVRLEPLQISVARFFQNELEVAGVLKRLRIAAPLPIQFERAGQLALVAESAQKRLQHRQVQYARGRLAVVMLRRLQVECSSCIDVIGVIQSRAALIEMDHIVCDRRLGAQLLHNQVPHFQIRS